MKRLYRNALAAILVLSTSACDELDLNGRLGRGEFEYLCGGPGDAACHGTGEVLGFDLDRDVLPIAVGANFGMQFDGDEAATLMPASSAIVSTDGPSFTFESVGTVDFLALDSQGTLLDFASIRSLTPTRIGLFEGGDETVSIEERRFQEFEIAAAPLDGNKVLGGGRAYIWSINGDGVSMTGDADGDNVVTLTVEDSAAVAVVTATSAEFSASMTVTASN